MKNHIRVEGRLLQTNKKWGALKQKQREWIMETAKKQYDRFIDERGQLPVHGSKQQLIEQIYGDIEARGVWIPFSKVKRELDVSIARWNRREVSQHGLYESTVGLRDEQGTTNSYNQDE